MARKRYKQQLSLLRTTYSLMRLTKWDKCKILNYKKKKIQKLTRTATTQQNIQTSGGNGKKNKKIMAVPKMSHTVLFVMPLENSSPKGKAIVMCTHTS